MALLGNVLGFLALLVIFNLPAQMMGLNFSFVAPDPSWFHLRGWSLGVAWLVLLPLLGAARWSVLQSDRTGSTELTSWITKLAVACASYAYFTAGLAALTGIDALYFGMISNAFLTIAAGTLACLIWPMSKSAAVSVALVAVWSTIASIGVAEAILTVRVRL